MNLQDLNALTYPLVVVRETAPNEFSVTQAVGTAFYVSPHVVVTCWHCVETPLPAGHFYALRVSINDGTFRVAVLSDIKRDSHGTDMATATSAYAAPRQVQVTQTGAAYGEEVWTFAYPYTQTSRRADDKLIFEISGRLLRGHVMRDFFYPHPHLGQSEAYELDMPTPPGTSGAPLMRKGTVEVVGVVFGAADVSTIVEFASVGADGVRNPETLRLATFGLAYDHDWFLRLTTDHTNNLPLGAFLAL